jgi:hypothetical protein
VRRAPLLTRSKSGAPSSCSRRCTRRLIAGWERCRVAAARVNPPPAYDRDEGLDVVEFHDSSV